jgi:hypothetical protein
MQVDAELRRVGDHVAATAERPDDQAHARSPAFARRLLEDDPAGLDLDGRLAEAEVEEVGAAPAFDAPADDVALMVAQRLAVEPMRRDLVQLARQAGARRGRDLRSRKAR